MTGCRNGHDPFLIETRPNGARVCRACAAKYHGRRRAHAKANITPQGEANHDRRRH